MMRAMLPLLLTTALAGSGAAVEIVAHRGASYDAPENTLAAVNLAWMQHADAVEIDIHLTADGRIVAIHDKTTKRTAGGEDVPVASLTLAELRRLDVGRWKDEKFANERIPALEEILQTIPDGKRLFIEIKAGPEILPELQRVIEQAGRPPAQTAIIGFSYETVQTAKSLLPALKVYWLVKLEKDKETGRLNHTAADLARQTREAHLDGIDLGNSPPLTEAFVQTIREAGLEVYVWTVNDVVQARAYRQLGVQGITTDRPALLREALAAP